MSLQRALETSDRVKIDLITEVVIEEIENANCPMAAAMQYGRLTGLLAVYWGATLIDQATMDQLDQKGRDAFYTRLKRWPAVDIENLL